MEIHGSKSVEATVVDSTAIQCDSSPAMNLRHNCTVTLIVNKALWQRRLGTFAFEYVTATGEIACAPTIASAKGGSAVDVGALGVFSPNTSYACSFVSEHTEIRRSRSATPPARSCF